jgi:hypothetical protein
VLSRDQLRRAVVGHGADPYDRNVDMLIARLRRKIEPDPKSPAFILTVPGLGYKFAARPQSGENGQSVPAIDLERPKEARIIWLNQSGLDGVKTTSAPGHAGSPHSESGRRQVSVLSCGLIGSPALAVNLDLEDFGSAIRRFQDICTSVIQKWGGVVSNSVGDEILALFGYPRATGMMLNAQCMQASIFWQMPVSSYRHLLSHCLLERTKGGKGQVALFCGEAGIESIRHLAGA